MIVIDSSALLSILFKEVDALSMMTALATAEGRYMSAVSLLEAGMVAAARAGEAGQADFLELIESQGVTVVPFDAEQAALAVSAFRRFGKGRHPAGLNMGDCASYALAAARGLPLLYKGDDFGRTDVASVL